MGSRNNSQRKKSKRAGKGTDVQEQFCLEEGMMVLYHNNNIKKKSQKEEYWLAEIQTLHRKLIFVSFYLCMRLFYL